MKVGDGIYDEEYLICMEEIEETVSQKKQLKEPKKDINIIIKEKQLINIQIEKKKSEGDSLEEEDDQEEVELQENDETESLG